MSNTFGFSCNSEGDCKCPWQGLNQFPDHVAQRRLAEVQVDGIYGFFACLLCSETSPYIPRSPIRIFGLLKVVLGVCSQSNT